MKPSKKKKGPGWMIFDKILLNNLKKERKRGLNEVLVILVILYLIFFFFCQIHNISSIKLNIKSINRDDLYEKYRKFGKYYQVM